MITAIILAAGMSRRMGQPKMLLPWGKVTVIEHVISVFQKAGVEDIYVITGGVKEQIESLVSILGAKTIYNKDYSNGDMLSSIQCGIRALTSQTQGMLIGLGDQPQVRESSVRMVCEAFQESKSNIVVPSFQMRRGHPWLVARPLWNALSDIRPPQSPRDFLNAHREKIQYIEVDDPNIFADLDTPEDYQKRHP